MPQESAEAWVGRMAEPFKEWYSALKASYPTKVRVAVCGAFTVAALSGGAGIVEGVFLHREPPSTEEERQANAAAADRVGIEFKVAGGVAATGLAVMVGSALRPGRPRDQ